MARRKSAAVEPPATTEAAMELLKAYCEQEHLSAMVKARFDRKIAALLAERDALLVEASTMQARRFAKLKAWWEVAGHKLVGKNRSLQVGGIELGLRLTNPKLGYLGKFKEVVALTWLRSQRWDRVGDFVRTTVELDKKAILKALRDPKDGEAQQVLTKTFEVLQKDEFFITVAAPPAPAEEPQA